MAGIRVPASFSACQSKPSGLKVSLAPMADLIRRQIEIFAGALELRAGPEREAYLQQACGLEVALRQRIDALLIAHDGAGTFLESNAAGGPTARVSPEDITTKDAHVLDKTGDRIGRYKLLEKIGEGGFGEVWMAEQDEPVQRRVALKLIKLGMDTGQVVARFEAERQALAMMNHPNIAQVFDGGATENGRPYFVMELVRGVKITDYCDQHQMPVAERLELFATVCQAVQHAHQKGIIHRDLKPSNILVTLHDGRPVPKVIDFGIAKATQGRLTDKTLFTQFRAFIGTPAYISPEQAEMSGLDIDTRSDIYSLGVLLYELLTGRTPLDTQELLQAGFEQMCRSIRERDPLRPSTRLKALQQADLTSTAQRRRTEAPKLIHLLRGDLDWIVMKSLEKDRARRYETANGLAREIERYLKNEPVVARPPSNVYRCQKFVARHRTGVGVTAGFVLLLASAAIVSATLAFWANRERRQAQSVLNFFQERVLAAPRPKGQEGGLARDVTLRAALDTAEPSIADAFANEPLVEASIREVLGTTYHHLGDAQRAETQHRRALELRQKQLGMNNPDTIAAQDWLGQDLRLAGKPSEAIPLFEQALKSALHVWGPIHSNTFSVMNDLGHDYAEADRVSDSIALLEKTLRLRRQYLGPENPDTMISLHNLAYIYSAVGRDQEALPLMEQVLELSRKHGRTRDPDTLTMMNNLADQYRGVGNFARGASLHQEVLTNRQEVLSPRHKFTLGSMNNLALAWRELGRFQQAYELLENAAALGQTFLPTNDPYTITFLNNLGLAAEDLGRTNQALLLLKQTFQQRLTTIGPDDAQTLRAMNYLARAQMRYGQLDAAENLLGEAEKRWRAANLVNGALASLTLANLAELRLEQKRYADAATLAQEYLKLVGKSPPRPWWKAEASGLLAAAMVGQGTLTEAGPQLTAAFHELRTCYARTPAHMTPRMRQLLQDSVNKYSQASGRNELLEEWRRWTSSLSRDRTP